MLRNVLEDYLSRLRREREFDIPILALLPAMGFFDVHFTHGTAEFGKDFIAKRIENQQTIQYSFQSKCGDIGQADWRNDIMGQMLEALLTTLSHPHFDNQMCHQAVLITTGRLLPNTAVAVQDFNNNQVENIYHKRPIILWDKEKLVSLFTEFGFEGVYRSNATELVNYGQFFVAYGEASGNILSDQKIEKYSRNWCNTVVPTAHRMLLAGLEAEALASISKVNSNFYEVACCYFGFIRAILFALHTSSATDEQRTLREMYSSALLATEGALRSFIVQIKIELQTSTHGVVELIDGSAQIVTYPILCSRILEATSLLYFMTSNHDERRESFDLLERLVTSEPGSGHIIGDRYAVSIAVAFLALKHNRRDDLARQLLLNTITWVCDRCEHGEGLAPLEADAYTEVALLFGHPFLGVETDKTHQSFVATVVADASVCLGDGKFYEDVVNDIMACHLVLPYWQPQDTEGQYIIDGADVVQYPNVRFDDTYSLFKDYAYAEHIKHEPTSFKIADQTIPLAHIIISLLLRDRYFPTLWDKVLSVVLA